MCSAADCTGIKAGAVLPPSEKSAGTRVHMELHKRDPTEGEKKYHLT